MHTYGLTILTGMGSKSSCVETVGQCPGMIFASRDPKTAKNTNSFKFSISKLFQKKWCLNLDALIKGKA